MTNSIAVESAVDKGTTPSRALFEHVLLIKRIQFKFKFVLHAIYCSGTKMTCQGTDSVSRGILNQGLLSGNPLCAYVSLNLSAHERFPDIKVCLRKWLLLELMTLTLEG